jgi:Bacteriophage HK97-gp10, putative tail-component
MADGIEITLEGLPEFSRMMTDLAGPAAERIIRHAVREGGRVVQAAITEAAPVRPDLPSGTALPPGALKNDIVVKVRKEPDGSISAYIEPGSKTLHVARFVEWGHRLVREGRSRKRGGTLGQSYVGNGKVVGGVPAYPFIRPAFDASEAAAQDAIAMDIAASFGGAQVVVPDDVPELESGE